AERLREGLRDIGRDSDTSRCQIVPLIVGDPRAAVRLSRALEQDGLLVPAIRPLSVPVGTARLRISLTAGHSGEDVERLLAALQRASLKSGEVGGRYRM